MSAWTFCSWLAPQIEAFINLRRLSGTDYRQQTESLGYFDRFLVANGIHQSRMTREICDRYQDSLSPLAPSTRANRFCVVRLLCEYLTRTDPLSYIPERLPWPGSPRRPYIFRHEQVVALLTAALRLPPPGSLRPHTVRTLLGLRVGSLPPQQARIVVNASIEHRDEPTPRLSGRQELRPSRSWPSSRQSPSQIRQACDAWSQGCAAPPLCPQRT